MRIAKTTLNDCHKYQKCTSTATAAQMTNGHFNQLPYIAIDALLFHGKRLREAPEHERKTFRVLCWCSRYRWLYKNLDIEQKGGMRK